MMHTRIGINTGTATVGNMGSSSRFNYTMMGDTVNLAARCESGAAIYGASTIITENTVAAITDDEICIRLLDRVRVKGRETPVTLYEVLGRKPMLPQELSQGLRSFEQGINAYFQQEWTQAIEHFECFEPLEPIPPPYTRTTPSRVFIQRCEHMRKHPPPENWEGIHDFQVK